MKIKTLILTVLALAALAAVAYFANRSTPPPSADARVSQPLLQPAAAEAAAKVKIADQGKSVLLAKQPDGSWHVSSYYDLPADFSKLSTLVGELTAAKVEQLVTANPEKLTRLEFKDTQIALLDSGDKPLWNITLGKNADAGGRFVRFGDEAKGFRANLNVWLDPESKNWANASLVELKPDEVSRIEMDVPGMTTPVIVTRAKKEDAFVPQNAPAGQKLKTDKITSVLSTLTGLRFTETTEVADPNAVAAKQNLRNVKLTTFDGKVWTISLGRKPEQKIVKAPEAKPDGKTGPAALGSVTAVAKPESSADAAKPEVPHIPAPEIETIPPGPVYAFVTSSNAQAPINTLMTKRGFQVGDFDYTNLPQKPEELFEAAPPPAPAAPSPAGAAGAPAGSPATDPAHLPPPAPAPGPK